MKRKLTAAVVGAFSLCLTGTASLAGSQLMPGISTGIPLGAPLPEGVFDITIPTWGSRDTKPARQEVGAIAPAWLIWSTPWSIAGGKIMFDVVTPIANVRIPGVIQKNGMLNPFLDAQIKWDLGGGFFGGFQAGVYLPVSNGMANTLGVARDFYSFQGIAALSYLKDGWNLSSTLVAGTGRSAATATPGHFAPSWMNLDLTATKKFGKFEIGAIAFGSMDTSRPVAGYAKQKQFAVGGLVGYDFGAVNAQLRVSRDVYEKNYGGYDTRVWATFIVPLYVAQAPKPVAAKY